METFWKLDNQLFAHFMTAYFESCSVHVECQVSLLTHFIFKLPEHPSEPIKNNLTAANTAEVFSATQGSSNLLQEQPRLLPVCASMSSPPHPYYGYVQRSPRMRNFNPGAPPNVTVGPQGFHRVMVPEQANLFLSYSSSPLDSPNFTLPCLQVTFFVWYSQRLE